MSDDLTDNTLIQ